MDREIRLRTRTRNNNVYDNQTRDKVGKWTAENGNASAVKRVNIPESTVRNFKRRYTYGFATSSSSIQSISNKTRGRPCKLGSFDAVVQVCSNSSILLLINYNNNNNTVTTKLLINFYIIFLVFY